MGAVAEYHIKPPVTAAIEAVEWDGTPEDAASILEWFQKFRGPNETMWFHEADGTATDVTYIMLKTGHISMSARKGDYIVRSSKSKTEPKKFQIYKKHAFEAGFYKVGDPSVTNVQ